MGIPVGVAACAVLLADVGDVVPEGPVRAVVVRAAGHARAARIVRIGVVGDGCPRADWHAEFGAWVGEVVHVLGAEGDAHMGAVVCVLATYAG